MRKFSTKKIRAKIDHIILTEQKITSSLKKNSKKYRSDRNANEIVKVWKCC